MNIFSKLFGNKSCEKTIIEKTVENNSKITIKEAEKKMEENSFKAQGDLAYVFVKFFDAKEETVFDSCYEASAMSYIAIYLQDYYERRISLADVICFFQLPIHSICEHISNILDGETEKIEPAKCLTTLLSDEEQFDLFKETIFRHFSKYPFLFPDLKTFKVTESITYMIENDIFNVAHCSAGSLQDYIEYNY